MFQRYSLENRTFKRRFLRFRVIQRAQIFQACSIERMYFITFSRMNSFQEFFVSRNFQGYCVDDTAKIKDLPKIKQISYNWKFLYSVENIFLIFFLCRAVSCSLYFGSSMGNAPSLIENIHLSLTKKVLSLCLWYIKIRWSLVLAHKPHHFIWTIFSTIDPTPLPANTIVIQD